MKTITKFAAVGLMALGMAGCAEDNESGVMRSDDGKTTVGVTPPTAAKSSEDFLKMQQENDPMKKAGASYKNKQ